MADHVRRLITQIRLDAVGELFVYAGLGSPPLEDGAKRAVTKAIMAAIEAAPEAARNTIEGIANDVVGFCSKTTYADMALRGACADEPTSADIIEDDVGLMERSLLVLLHAPRRFARARNVASGLNWRGGRYHCGYRVADPETTEPDLGAAVERIAEAIQKQQGGRRVQQDTFTFQDPLSDDGAPSDVTHIAVYVEAAAVSNPEFVEDADEVQQVVRRPARELSVDYHHATGRLDIAGYGVGGSATLAAVAQLFRTHAIADAEMVTIEPRCTHVDEFAEREVLPPAPPKGMTRVIVREIRIRSRREDGGMATFRSKGDRSAYDRMRDLGVGFERLVGEFVRGVTLEFTVAPEREGEEPRTASATLTWPNSLTFDNARVADRQAIEAYLVAQGYLDPERIGDALTA